MRCTSSVSAPISLRDFLGIPGRLVSSTQQTITTTSTSRASTSTSTSTSTESSRTSTSTSTSQASLPQDFLGLPGRLVSSTQQTSTSTNTDSSSTSTSTSSSTRRLTRAGALHGAVGSHAMPRSARRGGRRSVVQSVSHVAATAALPWRRDALCVDKGEEETRASEPVSDVTAGTNSDGQQLTKMPVTDSSTNCFS